MNQEELNRFLASVRRTRFVDYLDPMGETAHEALERRLKWAERSLNDPANADEAEFLLRNAPALRDLVTEELVGGDDDWIESADAGSEWGGGGWTSTPAPTGAEPREPLEEHVPEPDDDYDPDMERTGIMRLEDITNPPLPPRIDTPSIGTPPTPSYSPADDDDLPDEVVRDIWKRNAPETPSVAYTPAPAGRSGPVEHDIEDGPPMPEPSLARRSVSPTPQRERVATPSASVDSADQEDSVRSALQIRASRSGAAAPRQRPGRQGSNRGRIVLFTVLLGAAAASTAAFLGYLPIPGQAVGEVANGEVAVEPAEPVAVAEAADPDEAPVEEVAAADVTAEEGAAEEGAAEEVVEEPVAEAPVAEAPVAVKPVAAAAPEPAPVAKPPAPAAPVPAPVAKEPPPVVKPPAPVAAKEVAPKEPAPAEAPKPEPKPEPEPAVADAPAPRIGADVIVEAPEAVTYPTLTGMWVGLAASRSFQLKVDSQSGGSFSGVAEVMNEAGEWDKLSILGTITPEGKLKFSQMGGGASFSGTIDGIRASGTVKLAPDGAPEKWSVIK